MEMAKAMAIQLDLVKEMEKAKEMVKPSDLEMVLVSESLKEKDSETDLAMVTEMGSVCSGLYYPSRAVLPSRDFENMQSWSRYLSKE
ncbi:hypothetical protein D3C87_1557530 [compost metagenome]